MQQSDSKLRGNIKINAVISKFLTNFCKYLAVKNATQNFCRFGNSKLFVHNY